MKLPYAAKAQVERKKAVEYLLSFSHPDGSSKAKVVSKCGFRVDEWEVLTPALRKHGREHVVSVSVRSAQRNSSSIDGALDTRD